MQGPKQIETIKNKRKHQETFTKGLLYKKVYK